MNKNLKKTPKKQTNKKKKQCPGLPTPYWPKVFLEQREAEPGEGQEKVKNRNILDLLPPNGKVITHQYLLLLLDHRATQWGAANSREQRPEQGALIMTKTYRDNNKTECCIECGGVTEHFLLIPGITDPDGFTKCRHCFANLLVKRTVKHMISRCPKTRNETKCLCTPKDDLCYRY